MSDFDLEYNKLLALVLSEGEATDDRTGVGTLSVFGAQAKFDLRDGDFPLLTTKKIFTKGIFHELLWFISGNTNIKYLLDNDVHIWDEWTPAYKEGGYEAVKKAYEKEDLDRLELGPIYSKQWRDFNGQDQLLNVIDRIKSNPTCRRLIVSAWNPEDIPSMALPPCHTLFQFKVTGEYLNLQLYQRSADLFLGVPFNIASYSLLLCMVAQVTGYKPGVFTHTFGDLHIYNNHTEQVIEQLSRKPFKAPQLKLNSEILNIETFTYDDIMIENYKYHPTIKAPIAV